MVNGIDVSDFQPNVNWNEVHESGYSFAYAKATEGTDFTAQTFAPNWSGLKAAGMLRGAYHMFHFDDDPVAQANYFLSVVNPQPGDLPPALDLELTVPPGVDPVQAISQWLHVVEARAKVRCVLYMGYYFWQGALGSTTDFSGHPLWLAQYSGGSAPSLIPSCWTTWTFWQYTDQDPVSGCGGAVDADKFDGDLDQLKAMCTPA
jgi:lysozyme